MNIEGLIILIAPILIGLIIYAVALVIVRTVVVRTKLSEGAKKSIMLIVYGPVAVGVLGYGAITFISLNRTLFPEYVTIGNSIFFVELVFVAVSVTVANRIGKILVVPLTEKKSAQRLLSFALYTLGLLALFYVLFTSPISPGYYAYAWQIVNFITGIVVTYMIAHIVNIILLRYASAIVDKQPQIHTTITFGRRVLIGVIVLIGASAATFAAFPTAGVAIASLFVAAGFSSIVVGLAAQSSLSNLIAGGVLALSQPFKIGDAIVFNNEYCYVEDIRLMITVLRIWDNRRLMVPNKLFLDSVVVNYTAIDPTKLVMVYMQITLESNLDKASEIMRNVAASHPDFLPSGNLPTVVVMNYSDSGVNLRLLSNARDQSTAFQMERDLLYEIKKEFDKNGIKLAFPRREITFGEGQDDRFKTQ